MNSKSEKENSISTDTDSNIDSNINSNSDSILISKGRLTSIGEQYSEKLTKEFFFTIRGSENVHIYWWVAKDLGWSIGNRILGMTSGVLAMCWVGVLLYNALLADCTEDAYMLIPMFLWLFGNFWWMDGELINDDDNIQAPEGGYCMLAGIILIIIYHICLKPMKLLKDDPKMTKLCKECNLIPRFSYFSTWRQYEVNIL